MLCYRAIIVLTSCNLNFQDLKEWRLFKQVQSLVSGGESVNVLEFWYKYYNLRADPRTWLPPFDGETNLKYTLPIFGNILRNQFLVMEFLLDSFNTTNSLTLPSLESLKF